MEYFVFFLIQETPKEVTSRLWPGKNTVIAVIEIINKAMSCQKIPHKGDKESLDRWDRRTDTILERLPDLSQEKRKKNNYKVHGFSHKKILGKPRENYGKTLGKPQEKPREDPGKTPGKPQDNPRRTLRKPLEKPPENPEEPQENPMKIPGKPWENPRKTPGKP
jgi:hypothetical protein